MKKMYNKNGHINNREKFSFRNVDKNHGTLTILNRQM